MSTCSIGKACSFSNIEYAFESIGIELAELYQAEMKKDHIQDDLTIQMKDLTDIASKLKHSTVDLEKALTPMPSIFIEEFFD